MAMGLNLNNYYSSKSLNIVYSENFLIKDFVESLDERTYIFFQFPFNIERSLSNTFHYFNFIQEYAPNFDLNKNIIYCSPNKTVHDKIVSDGYNSIILNHNCLLDYNRFEIGSEERIYDVVINSRPFYRKRVFLANKIKSLAYIKGYDWANDHRTWSGWRQRNFALLVENVGFEEVTKIYNKSKIGMILSGHTGVHPQEGFEGANYSSSEYLLCGLPVISTPSQGGRDEWFTDENSLICKPNEDSVYETYLEMMEKLNTNEIDREHIRNTQVEKMKVMRKSFVAKTRELFEYHDIKINSKKYFNENYFHKMIKYAKGAEPLMHSEDKQNDKL